MLTARPLSAAVRNSLGVGGINAYGAARLSSAPNPNLALRNFVTSSGPGGELSFDAASWASVVQANASWADASWADASWADASWSSASWADASWADASWADASWADASWAAASWADSAVEDGADGEGDGQQPAAGNDAIKSLQKLLGVSP
jgi:hypothetical protein